MEWRFFDHPASSGADNMAIDEALLESCVAGNSPPILRLYRWQPACLSLGRFQRSSDINPAACAAAGISVVRRPSGGRALLHAAELTYAVIARADDPLVGGESILSSYQRISQLLLVALAALGVAATLAPARRVSQPRSQNAALSPACFDTPAGYEVTVAGRKLVGSAQARRAGVLLQHGAIPLQPHAEQLLSLLQRPAPQLAEQMITLDQAAGMAISDQQLTESIIVTWQQHGVQLIPDQLSPAEEHHRQELQHNKYTQDWWTYER